MSSPLQNLNTETAQISTPNNHSNRYTMADLQFNWNWPKVEVAVNHVADQARFNCAFSGQDADQAYERDIKYYNGHPTFSKMEVTKRHLHGKEGLYAKLYGTAEALRSQLVQKGRDAALILLTPKSVGVSAATMIRDGVEYYVSSRHSVFDLLLMIANNQLETTSDPERMTRYERLNYDKAGKSFAWTYSNTSTDQLIPRSIMLQLRQREKRKRKKVL